MTVLPGLIDSHIHAAEGALGLGGCSVDDQQLTVEAAGKIIRECLAKDAEKGWRLVSEVNSAGFRADRKALESTARVDCSWQAQQVARQALPGRGGHEAVLSGAPIPGASISTCTRSATQPYARRSLRSKLLAQRAASGSTASLTCNPSTRQTCRGSQSSTPSSPVDP
jgi:hypothetical protein